MQLLGGVCCGVTSSVALVGSAGVFEFLRGELLFEYIV